MGKKSKPMTKSQIVSELSDLTELSKKDIKNVLESITELAYNEAPKGFTLPGLGKLIVVHRKKRKGRNPATGESIMIPAKKALKFRISKAAKDAVVPQPKKKKKGKKRR